ncbi:MAG: hypothetical protein WC915_01865 [archaeon]|jgi:hypothetical protein
MKPVNKIQKPGIKQKLKQFGNQRLIDVKLTLFKMSREAISLRLQKVKGEKASRKHLAQMNLHPKNSTKYAENFVKYDAAEQMVNLAKAKLNARQRQISGNLLISEGTPKKR